MNCQICGTPDIKGADGLCTTCRRAGGYAMKSLSPASQLGKMAAGVPKKFSAAEIAKRTARLKTAQKKRAKTQRALRRSNDKLRDAAT